MVLPPPVVMPLAAMREASPRDKSPIQAVTPLELVVIRLPATPRVVTVAVLVQAVTPTLVQLVPAMVAMSSTETDNSSMGVTTGRVLGLGLGPDPDPGLVAPVAPVALVRPERLVHRLAVLPVSAHSASEAALC